MTSVITAVELPHIWSTEALHSKSQRYVDLMLLQEKNEWQFAFWSSLALEMVAKAALSHISPVLLADGRDWNNIYFSLGYNPIAKKFSPKSVDISEVLNRLETLLPNFTREMLSFCIAHMSRRNSELHSGELPFDNFGTSKWLPMYYFSMKELLSSYDESLDSLFGEEEAKSADELIQAYSDDAAKSVRGMINAHTQVWQNKTEAEQELLKRQASTRSSRHDGHRIKCPACENTGLLHGSAFGKANSKLKEDIIVEKQNMLPSSFECIACGLRIAGHSKLIACGLGDSFVETTEYDAVEYFNISIDDFDFEPDFNER